MQLSNPDLSPVSTITTAEIGKNVEEQKSTTTATRTGWYRAVAAGIIMSLLALWPQITIWMNGSSYHGATASGLYDEEIYQAYVNGLTYGRPRRSDPLVENQAGKPPPESLFSIQFVPSYLLSFIARITGATAATTFILLSLLIAFLSVLAIFRLIATITGDELLAVCGAFFILCFGTVAGGEGVARTFLNLDHVFGFFPFLRRYQPGFSFPLFFVFVLLVWRSFTQQGRKSLLAAFGAALVFAVLVFSYLYLWTAALAWVVCFTILWLITDISKWKQVLCRLAPLAVIGTLTLTVYAWMLNQISETTSRVQILEHTNLPDLARWPEMTGAVALLLMMIARRQKKIAQWSDPVILLTCSLGLVPFLIFNQQIITGRSLQPFHYSVFIGNYVALLALVFSVAVFLRSGTKKQWFFPQKPFLLLMCVIFIWGLIESADAAQFHYEGNLRRDSFIPVAERLNQLDGEKQSNSNDRAVVFSPDIFSVSDNIAAYTPMAVLWATHLPVCPTLTADEQTDRFFLYLYYSAVTPEMLERRLREREFTATSSLLGFEKVVSVLSVNQVPSTEEEIQNKVSRYRDYIATFDHNRATHPTLSYVVVTIGKPDWSVTGKSMPGLSNLDRWYIRDAGERIGIFTLYRVSLR